MKMRTRCSHAATLIFGLCDFESYLNFSSVHPILEQQSQREFMINGVTNLHSISRACTDRLASHMLSYMDPHTHCRNCARTDNPLTNRK